MQKHIVLGNEMKGSTYSITYGDGLKNSLEPDRFCGSLGGGGCETENIL